MTNIGKERYEQIPVPDQLEWVVAQTCRRTSRKRMIQKWVTSAVAVFALLVVCANITPIYASAVDVPVLGQVVRILRIGSGGRAAQGVHVTAAADKTGVEIQFRTQSGEASDVPVYSVTRRIAPFRVILRLHGIEEMDEEALLRALSSCDAVQEAYLNAYPAPGDQGVTLVLRQGYDCSVEEISSPGTLAVSFHDGETVADTTVSYYLRSAAMPLGDELAELTQTLSWEGATQVRTVSGDYCVVLGNYRTKEQANCAKIGLEEKNGRQLGLETASGGIYETPQN